ncbi:oligoribonuclease [Paraneptunicella aestuarii]|uniref:oligoribonuclease n=1 Tax=Paraneptunicella aestuarii TaxID=2831148 RepID=UPI001E2A412D|nr:oligoribonuclease [Paraneptunicella aestuarii]UAA38737.1 oligoribonuclease [Paraneptunicella aestuarii]
MSYSENNLVWIDMEMSGLNPDTDKVLEIASIVTDAQLNILAEGPVIAVHQGDDVLDSMDEWNTNTHGNSGLIARCKASSVNEDAAVQQTLDFLKQYVPVGVVPLCGNSIGQDRRFMVRHMPELDEFFHYRMIDVSTVKELVRRWKPEILDGFTKKGSHQALDDIRESIMELDYYRKHVFVI